MVNIKNSSNKIIGFTDIKEDYILIHNNKKPELVIKDKKIIDAVKNKNRDNNIIKELYDNYYLMIGEIASLYDVCYSNINKQYKQNSFETTPNAGRRNSNFGKVCSKKTKEKISNSLKDGYKTGRISPASYVRTKDIKQKISKSLKEYYKSHKQNPLPHIQNWENGVYDKVDFHIGIGGSFYSIKNSKRVNFRSLLELFYLLKLEKSQNVKEYSYEPIRIPCDNGHAYTPDVLVNNYELIELKSRKYVSNVKGVREKVLYKAKQAEKYCLNNKLAYKIVYDDEINFISREFKMFLRDNPQIIDKYKIVFNQPERMVIK